MSGISQPIEYCTTRSATTSQWNTFAVVPYCKRSVMRFLDDICRASSRRSDSQACHDALITSLRQGCGSRDEECDIGLTGPAAVARLPAPGLLPGTGNAYPTMVLTTKRSDAGVNP